MYLLAEGGVASNDDDHNKDEVFVENDEENFPHHG
jgi:hypothetical protein